MVALTQLNPTALPGGRYGSFAGKEADSGVAPGPHNPGTITQLHPTALPGGRYGSFAGKESGATPTPTPTATPVGGWVYDPYSRRRRRRDDEEPAPRPVPILEPVPDRTDEIAALDARIAELGETIAKSRRGRERMRARMRDLETERAVMARAQERRLRLLDDEDWFMMS